MWQEEIDKIFRLFDTEGKNYIEVKDVQKARQSCRESSTSWNTLKQLQRHEDVKDIPRSCQK